MVSSGYATEATYESIWDDSIATARFDNLNVRIGGILNFLVMGAAGTDITDADVTPVLEQITEEILIRVINLAQSGKYVDPSAYLAVMGIIPIMRQYKTILTQISRKLGYTEALEVQSISGLGANNTL